MIEKIKLIESNIEDVTFEDPNNDDGDELHIDLIISDDDGIIEDEPENEKARPPKLLKKQRMANAVKADVIKKMTGEDSPIKSHIDKIFTIISREIKKEAAKRGVAIENINLDKVILRR